MSPHHLLAATIAAAALAAAPSGAQAATWSAPVTLPAFATAQSAAIGSDGTAVVTWRSTDGLFVAGVGPDGTPTRSRRLVSLGRRRGAYHLSSAVLGDGTRVVAWIETRLPLADYARVAVARPGSTSFHVTTVGRATISTLLLGATGRKGGWLAWVARSGHGNVLRARRLPLRRAAPVQTITSRPIAAALTTTPAGAAYLAWVGADRASEAPASHVRIARAAAGHRFGCARVVTGHGAVQPLVAAVGERLALVWRIESAHPTGSVPTTFHGFRARTIGATGRLGATQILDDGRAFTTVAGLAGSAGGATASWSSADGTLHLADLRPGRATFGPAMTIAVASEHIALLGDGAALVATSEQVLRRVPGTTTLAPETSLGTTNALLGLQSLATAGQRAIVVGSDAPGIVVSVRAG